jgi:beta-glucosidase
MHDRLERCLAEGGFEWLTGIEDTFITAPDAKTGRILDEYELTGHYLRWAEDLELASELGVGLVRYGVPWHRISPAPGVWELGFAEQTLLRWLELGIEPIVDLVHYGTPTWMNGAFLNPDYERHVEEYAARVAEHFRGSVRYFTPLNEPRITAWYTGKLGWWPPGRRGWSGFVAVTLAIARGIVRTVRALRSVDPAVLCVHVDATDLYETQDPELLPEVSRRQTIVFLALDLVCGKVDARHPLYDWLLSHGASFRELEWLCEHAIVPDVVGMNLYPLFSRKIMKRSGGRLRTRMPYASADIVERLAELYASRYGRPVMITETASEGTVSRRHAWLRDSVAAVTRARARGIPLVGYTWWPMFALVTWAYRQGRKALPEYLAQMGLFDLKWQENGELLRLRTPLVDAYRELALAGAAPVGPIASFAAPRAQPGAR